MAEDVVKPDKLIISPEEAKQRVQGRATIKVADGGKGGKHAISRAESISIACQIGQQVYDQLRSEHAASMGQLQLDLRNHLNEIRGTVAINILDLQKRSFGFAVMYDCRRFAAWLAGKLELAKAHIDLWRGVEPPSDRAETKADPQSAVAGAIRGEDTESVELAFDTDDGDPAIAGVMKLHADGRGATFEPVASAACPICGREGAHQHTAEEIEAACQDEEQHIGAPTELPNAE